MRIRNISFDDDGMPERITAELSRGEALYLAKLTGKQSSTTADEIVLGGSEANGQIYSALAGDVFNRYYEEGADDRAALG